MGNAGGVMEDVAFEQTPEEVVEGESHPVSWELVPGRGYVSLLN